MTRSSRIAGVIPARMGSSRFPGKPLAPILGLPMIEHVFHRTRMCEALDQVVVATCDPEIHDAVMAFGGDAVMTSPDHVRATDRVAEAAEGLDADVIVMVQGDEPMVSPDMIDRALGALLASEEVVCVNLAVGIGDEEEFLSPDTIKVVMDRSGNALYFSREPIPTRRIGEFQFDRAFKQVCVIPFRRDVLRAFASLDPTPMEVAESVDMLRLLENGYNVRMVECDERTHAVDTVSDLALVQHLMRGDALLGEYASRTTSRTI